MGPNIIKSQRWMIVINKKSKGKIRASSSNMISISTKETKEDVTSLTSSREKESIFAADVGALSTSKTRSDKQYLKQYDESMVDFPNQLRR